MPESPEVQSLVEFVGERIAGRDIRELEVIDYPEYKTRDVPPSVLGGCRIAAVARLGKYIDIHAGAQHLAVSFGRGGWFVWHDDMADTANDPVPASQVDAPVVARLTLDDGSGFDVTDAGSFRSVGIWIVGEPGEVAAIAKLGPDPAAADFSRVVFDRAIVGRRKQLKAVLQEQASFAGIGNAYSDEILNVARLSPVVHASLLSADDRGRLFDAMQSVVRDAIDERRGIPIDRLKAAKADALQVHGRGGEPCVRGNGTVHDFTFGGASAQYCPECQTGGVVL